MCVICFEAIENGRAECVYVHQDNIMMRNQGLRGARQEKHKEQQRRTDGGLYSPAYLSLCVCMCARQKRAQSVFSSSYCRAEWLDAGWRGALSYMWNFLNELNIDKQDCRSTVLGSISASRAHQTDKVVRKQA